METKRFTVVSYEVGGSEYASFDTLDEAIEYAKNTALTLRESTSIIDSEIDGCGSEVAIVRCRKDLMKSWGEPYSMTFNTWAELEEYLKDPKRGTESLLYYWGFVDNFETWYDFKDLQACADEDWFEYGQTVEIWCKEDKDYEVQEN